jgi:hypothetical protein
LKTDDFVAMLASGNVAIAPHAAARRYVAALGFGALGSVILMLVLLGLRFDLADALWIPMFWVKCAFVAVLAFASVHLALRLARPGSNLRWVPGALAAPIIFMWLLAAFLLIGADFEQRHVLLFGKTSESCPWLIALLSVPVFVAVIWAMKGLAPTRLRLAGGAAGLAAGAVGALVYCLHCPEMAAPFLGTWYLLGMLIPTAVGAVLGPRLLRW